MSKKKACLNALCTDCRQTKYKASEQLCPHCQEKLEFVCAKKGCFKLLPNNHKDKYGMRHRVEIDDKKAELLDGVKKVGGLALSIGASIGASAVLDKFNIKKK